MNFWTKVISIFDTTMQEPSNYGWFHLLSVALIVVACVLAIIFAKKASYKAMKIVLIICASIMLLLELYKQITFTFEIVGGKIESDYQWYAFPFQFCSTPMYIMLIAGLIKSGKVQDALLSFLSYFSLFGGLCVLIYPNNVFTQFVGVNIQTMIHHGLQVIVGCFLLSYNKEKLGIKYFVKGIWVFLILTTIALGLNLIAPNFTNETFNMFYISPYFETVFPIISYIQNTAPYIVFLLSYIIGFSAAAYVIFLISFGVAKITNNK